MAHHDAEELGRPEPVAFAGGALELGVGFFHAVVGRGLLPLGPGFVVVLFWLARWQRRQRWRGAYASGTELPVAHAAQEGGPYLGAGVSTRGGRHA